MNQDMTDQGNLLINEKAFCEPLLACFRLTFKLTHTLIKTLKCRSVQHLLKWKSVETAKKQDSFHCSNFCLLLLIFFEQVSLTPVFKQFLKDLDF